MNDDFNRLLERLRRELSEAPLPDWGKKLSVMGQHLLGLKKKKPTDPKPATDAPLATPQQGGGPAAVPQGISPGQPAGPGVWQPQAPGGAAPAKYKAPKKWTSAGGIVMEKGDPSKVYVIKPAHNFGPWSYPKGKVDKGETLAQAAVREVWEETGIKAKIQTGKSYLGKGEGSMSVTHFYLMTRVGGSPTNFDRAETERVLLVPWHVAIALFKKAGNKRDVKISHRAMERLGIQLQKKGERPAEPEVTADPMTGS